MSEHELLPCPFCGDDGDKSIVEYVAPQNGDTWKQAKCRGCGATASLAAWNTRHLAQPEATYQRSAGSESNAATSARCTDAEAVPGGAARHAGSIPAHSAPDQPEAAPVAWRYEWLGEKGSTYPADVLRFEREERNSSLWRETPLNPPSAPDRALADVVQALEAATAAVWDGHYSGKGVTVEYARAIDAKAKSAIAALESKPGDVK